MRLKGERRELLASRLYTDCSLAARPPFPTGMSESQAIARDQLVFK